MGGDKTGDPNGFDWNLSDMENSTVVFHGTRLLTLSACSTAKDYRSRNGLEMDGLGMVAQQKEAEAVLATLWDVNDLSTSHIMSDFYARWVQNPAQGKAEALRQAQLAFLHGGAVAPHPAIAPSHTVASSGGIASKPLNCHQLPNRPRLPDLRGPRRNAIQSRLRPSLLLGALRPHRQLSSRAPSRRECRAEQMNEWPRVTKGRD